MESQTSSTQLLISNLFLLRELKSSPNESNHYCLISLLKQVLQSLIREIPRLQVVLQAFEVWSLLQSEDALDAVNLQKAIEALLPGEHLPLYICAQNACAIISRLQSSPSQSAIASAAAAAAAATSSQSISLTSSQNQSASESADDGIVFSTFAPVLPSAQVAEAEGDLLCDYPHTSIRVERSPLLLSAAFAQQIARLHVCPIDEATATKHRGSTVLFEVQWRVATSHSMKYFVIAANRCSIAESL